MKLKLKRNEMIAMIACIERALKQYDDEEIVADDMQEKLIKAALEELYVKLQKQGFEVHQQYSFKMKPTWAIALWLRFSDVMRAPTYEGNLILKLCNEINRQYA